MYTFTLYFCRLLMLILTRYSLPPGKAEESWRCSLFLFLFLSSKENLNIGLEIFASH